MKEEINNELEEIMLLSEGTMKEFLDSLAYRIYGHILKYHPYQFNILEPPKEESELIWSYSRYAIPKYQPITGVLKIREE